MARNFITRSPLIQCCLLAVFAWQALLPCVHGHDANNHAYASGEVCQPENKGQPCHDDAHASEATWCWHFHCDLPEPNGESKDLPGQCRHQLVAADALAGAGDVIRDGLLFASHPLCVFEVILPRSCPDLASSLARSVSGFFSTFAPEMPFPVRFGNLRC